MKRRLVLFLCLLVPWTRLYAVPGRPGRGGRIERRGGWILKQGDR